MNISSNRPRVVQRVRPGRARLVLPLIDMSVTALSGPVAEGGPIYQFSLVHFEITCSLKIFYKMGTTWSTAQDPGLKAWLNKVGLMGLPVKSKASISGLMT